MVLAVPVAVLVVLLLSRTSVAGRLCAEDRVDRVVGGDCSLRAAAMAAAVAGSGSVAMAVDLVMVMVVSGWCWWVLVVGHALKQSGGVLWSSQV